MVFDLYCQTGSNSTNPMIFMVGWSREITIFLANANGLFGANSFSSAPSKLNFAFTGILTIDGSSYDIVIGQGSNSEGND